MSKVEIKPIYLELDIDEDATADELEETLSRLVSDASFTKLIQEELYEMVVDAIQTKKTEFTAFRLLHYNIDLIIAKKHYKNLLNTVLTLFTQEEDYLKCIEIKNLIDSI